MVFVGLIFAKPVLELMDTPDDVINLSTLYMRIYFIGMPFFMLYNYGASILRAVGDTQTSVIFPDHSRNRECRTEYVSGDHFSSWSSWSSDRNCDLAVDFKCSCITLPVSVTDKLSVAIFKIKDQSRVFRTNLQVGIPAGIQSTVINFSNVLLQSSVNSFGSIAMAGYTAANNIFGFLYVTVNAVTQACMSFTSQNYGVGKWKRMDRVLIDCLILSFIAMMILGNSAYFFGPKLVTIYTSNPKLFSVEWKSYYIQQ